MTLGSPRPTAPRSATNRTLIEQPWTHPRSDGSGDTRLPGHRIRNADFRARPSRHRALPDEFIGDLVPHLEWVAGTGDQRSAAITFSSEGVISVRVAVQAELPPYASAQVFDGDGAPWGSAFTSEDFNPDEPIWLPSAGGDTLTVQITLPSAEALESLSFIVTKVAHRFASLIPKAVSRMRLAPVAEGLPPPLKDSTARLSAYRTTLRVSATTPWNNLVIRAVGPEPQQSPR